MDTNTESMSDLQIAPKPQGPSIFASSPSETVRFATDLANALKPVIEKQGMYSLISGKRHVKVEAWLTLGAMLGITPRETRVNEHPDGSYEAYVELLDRSGRVVGGASALCGVEESRWAKADRYARRSMAVTRATAKSYRIAFSWIIGLAGYEVTPAEELQADIAHNVAPPDRIPKYRHADKDAQDWLKSKLEASPVPKESWKDFSMGYNGQMMTDMAFEVAIAKWPKAQHA